jgi:hypothetical protein
MRYLISVIHDGPEPTDVPAALYQAMGAFVSKLKEDDVLIDAAGLARMEKAKRINLRGRKVTVVDGPYPETKEWLGGFFLVKVGSEKEALEIAQQSIDLHDEHFPGFDLTHEIRQVMEG